MTSASSIGDVQIQCRHPVTNKVTVFHRDQRKGFTYDSVVNGGDRNASWTVPCDKMAKIALPELNSRIKVVDVTRDKVLWSGLLRKPLLNQERGRPISYQFGASGYGFAPKNPFRAPTKFGDVSKVATIKQSIEVLEGGRIDITDLKDIMLHGLTRAPLINGVESHVATTGITLGADSEDFRGRQYWDLWTWVTSQTARLATPLIWMVYADESGDPALYFLSRPTAAEYFEHGRSKRSSLGVDAEEIANLITVQWEGHDPISVPDIDNGDPIDYSAIDDLQGHYTEVTGDIKLLTEAQGFAGGLYNKFNVREITTGSVTLDEDLRALYAGASTPVIIPITEVRAGKVIRLAVHRFSPYVSGSTANVFIASAQYNEDNCETVLSPEALTGIGKEARAISLLGSFGINWALASGTLPVPLQPYASVPRSDGAGSYTLLDLPQIPRPLDGTATQPPPPLVGVVTGMPPIIGSDENNAYGSYGVQVHPLGTPPQRVSIPLNAANPPDDDTDIPAGELGAVDALNCWVDELRISNRLGLSGTITVYISIYHWGSDVMETDVWTVALSGQERNRYQFDPMDPMDSNVKKLMHGDQLYFRSDGGTGVPEVHIALLGWKHWDEYPYTPGPNFLFFNGNSG